MKPIIFQFERDGKLYGLNVTFTPSTREGEALDASEQGKQDLPSNGISAARLLSLAMTTHTLDSKRSAPGANPFPTTLAELVEKNYLNQKQFDSITEFLKVSYSRPETDFSEEDLFFTATSNEEIYKATIGGLISHEALDTERGAAVNP